MSTLNKFGDEALIAFDHITHKASTLFSPNIRFGVTGLSRSGKTVFITALVHNLLHGGRLPMFSPHAEGRIKKAYLQPQPDDDVPRFSYESHINALLEQQIWPESTSKISQLRITIEYESASFWNKKFGSGKLDLDIIDYPGEWLLDLPLLYKSFAEWSKEAIALSNQENRKDLAKDWHKIIAQTKINDAQDDETTAREMAKTFTQYLRNCRADGKALSSLPPGRFLMPGDLEGSPALTFAPLPETIDNPSLYQMMERRYEAYKSIVIKPFFREHFARLDRQIVLVDALQAMNAGSAAVQDLEQALAEILECFRTGKNSWGSALFGAKVERILFAATKADQLHHENHANLERFLNRLLQRAIDQASYQGAEVQIAAIAAMRATREGNMPINNKHDDTLPVLIGTPIAGEKIDGEVFNGTEEAAIFPGDLPKNPEQLFDEDKEPEIALNFIRFKPPKLEVNEKGLTLSLPHIRLDRGLEFLFGDILA